MHVSNHYTVHLKLIQCYMTIIINKIGGKIINQIDNYIMYTVLILLNEKKFSTQFYFYFFLKRRTLYIFIYMYGKV